MAAPAARNLADDAQFGGGARERGAGERRRGLQALLEARMAADVQPAWVVEAAAKRMERWWSSGCGRSPGRAEIAALSSASQSVCGDGGLAFLRLALNP